MLVRALAAALGRPPWPPLLLASLCGWTVLALGGRALAVPALCGDVATLSGLEAALAANGPASLAWSWAVMLLAMTPLLVVAPVRRLWRGSLPHRRARAVAAFLVGDLAVWTLAGAALTAAAVTLVLNAGGLALPMAVVLAIVWRLSPVHRASLAHAHRVPRLRAFGSAADLDNLRYGLADGLWRLVTCWPLMLASLLTGAWHLPAMAAVAALMLLDRHATPPSPRWSTRFA
jgi:predicted metal-binding membrane protein